MRNIPNVALRVALSAVLLCLSSCSLFEKTRQEKTSEGEKEQTRLVGRIASVSSEEKFVLIQSYGTWIISTGTILVSRGTDGRTANLRVTGEKLGQFAAADIQSGSAEIGDGVATTINSPATAKQPSPEDTPEP